MRFDELDPDLLAVQCADPLALQIRQRLATALLLSVNDHCKRLDGYEVDRSEPESERLLLVEILQDLDIDADLLVELCGRLATLQRMTNTLAAAAARAGVIESGGPLNPRWSRLSKTMSWVLEAEAAAPPASH